MFQVDRHGKTKERAMLQGIEYRHFTKLRLFNLLLLGISALTILSVGIFMYHRIYSTIGQIQAIGLLKNQLGAEIIDFKNLGEIEEAWKMKMSTTTPAIPRDPFSPIVVKEDIDEDLTEVLDA
jgi:hypothetical protein